MLVLLLLAFLTRIGSSEVKYDSSNLQVQKIDRVRWEISYSKDEILIQGKNLMSKRNYQSTCRQSDLDNMGVSKKIVLVYRLLKDLLENNLNDPSFQLSYGFIKPKVDPNNTTSEKDRPVVLDKTDQPGSALHLEIDYKDRYNDDHYIFNLAQQISTDYDRLMDIIHDQKEEIEQLKKQLKSQHFALLGIWQAKRNLNPIAWDIALNNSLTENYLTFSDDDSKISFEVSGIYRIRVDAFLYQNNLIFNKSSVPRKCNSRGDETQNWYDIGCSHQFLNQFVHIQKGQFITIQGCLCNYDNSLTVEFIE